MLFREFPGLKKSLWSGEMWEDGYFARTVGDRMTSDVIKKYIVSHRDLEQGPAQLDLKWIKKENTGYGPTINSTLPSRQ